MGKRKCQRCGTWVKLSNEMLVGGLTGLVFAGIIVSSRYWHFPNEWIRFAVIVPICWIVGLIFVALLGRWEAVRECTEDFPKVCIWSTVFFIAVGVFVAAVIVINIALALLGPELAHTLNSVDPAADETAFEQSWLAFILTLTIGYGIIMLAVAVGIFAAIMRWKAKSSQSLSCAPNHEKPPG